MLCGDHQSPYGDASVTGLTNLLYEVKRLTMHIQPVVTKASKIHTTSFSSRIFAGIPRRTSLGFC